MVLDDTPLYKIGGRLYAIRKMRYAYLDDVDAFARADKLLIYKYGDNVRDTVDATPVNAKKFFNVDYFQYYLFMMDLPSNSKKLDKYFWKKKYELLGNCLEEYVHDRYLKFPYRVCNIDTLNKLDIESVKIIKETITKKELKNLFVLKNDRNFQSIAEQHILDNNFTFTAIEEMFKFCNVDISTKHGMAKQQLDKFFRKKAFFTDQLYKVNFYYYSLNNKL
ncbi:hypothetical protein FACS1894180_1720 [Bacteroidia bacterium]|nr:hypothetical protein FACS1894180_1720 [Bacteroidia bacterium]